MRNELERLLAEYKGMQRILNNQANSFPIKNKAWIQVEIIDDVVGELERVLNMKGVLD